MRFAKSVSVAVVNKSGAQIDDVSVVMGDRTARIGLIVDKGRKSYGSFNGTPPSSFTINWTANRTGQQYIGHEASRSGKGFDGTVYFLIDAAGGVTAKAIARDAPLPEDIP